MMFVEIIPIKEHFIVLFKATAEIIATHFDYTHRMPDSGVGKEGVRQGHPQHPWADQTLSYIATGCPIKARPSHFNSIKQRAQRERKRERENGVNHG